MRYDSSDKNIWDNNTRISLTMQFGDLADCGSEKTVSHFAYDINLKFFSESWYNKTVEKQVYGFLF